MEVGQPARDIGEQHVGVGRLGEQTTLHEVGRREVLLECDLSGSALPLATARRSPTANLRKDVGQAQTGRLARIRAKYFHEKPDSRKLA
ncbi:hypothetical protein [Reyranella sp.]|uniref:hypothetical protein n=1 Tax=Reyranella sp. TaxID=1929291 RepID=UPI003D0B525A